MKSSTILVTGSQGQLGREIKELSINFPHLDFVFLSRSDASITDEVAMKHAFDMHKPAWLVNCAAYTAVDNAETEQELAFEINGNAVGHLAYLCRKNNTGFIHISTDYVFNGNHNKPWKENDETDPLNTYGASKLQGEFKAQKNNSDSIIIRTSWVYSPFGKNFVKTMIRLMNEKEKITVVNDQYGCPTYAADLADAIMKIILSKEFIPGIFHFSNQGIINWFDFANEIKNLIGSSCILEPIPTEKFPTPARRPSYSVMDTTKISSAYGVQPKDWKESLRNCISRINTIL